MRPAAAWLVAGACLLPLLAAGPAAAQLIGPCDGLDDCDLPPEGPIPFGWEDGASGPPASAPLPQGFVLEALVRPGASRSGDQHRTLDRYAQVAAALSQCWSPLLLPADAQWRDLTLRVSFKRNGAVNGVARVVHVSDAADAAAGERGRQSLLAALDHCTPLALSPSLGAAIAGQIFAIRFTVNRG